MSGTDVDDARTEVDDVDVVLDTVVVTKLKGLLL